MNNNVNEIQSLENNVDCAKQRYMNIHRAGVYGRKSDIEVPDISWDSRPL